MNYKIVFYTIGKVLRYVSMLLLLPLLVAIIYNDGKALSFVYTILIILAISFIISNKKPNGQNLGAKDGMVVVGLSWLLVSILGCLPFLFSGSCKSLIDCIFESFSSYSATGVTTINDLNIVSKSIIFYRSFSQWLGGMGILVFILAVLPKTNINTVHLLKNESTGPQVGKLVSKIKFSARILYIIYFVLTLIQIVLLSFSGIGFFESVILSFSTAATGGFSPFNNSVAACNSLYCEIIITIFMFLFSVNFNVFYLICIKKFTTAIKSEELRWLGFMIVAAIAMVTVNLTITTGNFLESLRHSTFNVVSATTTTGFTTTDLYNWPLFSQIILLIVMFIGGSAGSASAGLKVSRLIILSKSVYYNSISYFKPKQVNIVKFENKIIDDETVKKVQVYFAVYVMLTILSCLIISLDNFDFMTSFLSAVSCISGCGFGANFSFNGFISYSCFSTLSKIVLCFDMIVGRLEIFPVLFLFSHKTWKKL